MTITVLHVGPTDRLVSDCWRMLPPGIRTLEAETGQQALRTPGAHIVLLGRDLPGMDALDFCRRLAERTPAPLPIVLAAPDDDLDWLAAALDAGALACVPRDPRLIVAQVSSAVRRIRAREADDAWTREAKTGTQAIPDHADGASATVLDITERKRAEAALRSSEETYRRLFDNMSEGLFLAEIICDEARRPIDFRYLDLNPAFERLLGLHRDEVVGRTVCEVLQSVEDDWLQTFGRVALTGEPACLTRFSAALGRYYSTVAYSPRPGQFACLFTDVTDKKLVEIALRARDERLRLATEATALGIFDFDLESGTVECDARIREWWGVPADGPVSDEAFAAAVHPDDRAATASALERATGSKGSGEFTAEFRLLGGRVVAATGRVTVGGDGRHLVGTARDITEAHQAAERLKQQAVALEAAHRAAENERCRLRAVLEAMPAGVAIVNAAGGVELQNAAMARVWGGLPAPADSVSDYVAYKAWWPDTGRPLSVDEWASARVVATGEAVIDQFVEIERFDGGRAFILNSASPLFDKDGRHVGGVVSLQDVTALRRAQDALQEADRRKDEFIALLSHELRNPLAPIRYALPALQSADLLDPARRAVEVVERQVAHLTRLMDDLLDASRIVTGKLELQRGDVALGDVINAATEAAGPAVARERHSLRVEVPSEPIWVNGDSTRLAQVVTNLLDNSAKYTPPGGRLEVSASVEGAEAVIRVRDDGYGIPPEALPAVFEMFHQARPGNKAASGLGIGLALVKRLVELHGGSVEAKSDGVGRGAEFTVRLPIAVREPTDVGALAGPRAKGGGLKVLIVDDNADLVEMLSVFVESLGHQVRKALDGPSAVSAAVSFVPHVVLLDLGLPGMTGLEVARALRLHPETAGAHLVALTGWGQREDRRQTEAAGFDDHLTKPTDPDVLERLLNEVAARALTA
jgi:PAS domain S-box-containing protein